MRHDDLRIRSKRFALSIFELADLLPNKPAGWTISKQLLRSASSVAANYRAAGRGRSHAEFVAKMGIVVEEADETVFWLELIQEARLLEGGCVRPLLDEANELLRIFSASYQTARARQLASATK